MTGKSHSRSFKIRPIGWSLDKSGGNGKICEQNFSGESPLRHMTMRRVTTPLRFYDERQIRMLKIDPFYIVNMT